MLRSLILLVVAAVAVLYATATSESKKKAAKFCTKKPKDQQKHTMGSVSFGFQAGGQSQQTILFIMTQDGLDAILNEQVKVGADISAAAGPRGVGAEAATTVAGGKDVYVYSLNKGLFVGASIEGAIIAKRSDWNQAYYGRATDPRQIVQDNAVSNPNADPLRAAAELIR